MSEPTDSGGLPSPLDFESGSHHDLEQRFPPEVRGERPSSLLPLETLANRLLRFGPEEVQQATEELPELLWLLHMGVVLFWVHDDSPGQRRTRTLVAGLVPLVDRAVRLTRLPLVRGLVDDALGVVRQVRGG